MSEIAQALPTRKLSVQLSGLSGKQSVVVLDLDCQMREAYLRILIASGLPAPIVLLNGTEVLVFTMSDAVEKVFEPLIKSDVEGDMAVGPLTVIASENRGKGNTSAPSYGKGKGNRTFLMRLGMPGKGPPVVATSPMPGKGPPVFQMRSDHLGHQAFVDEDTGDLSALLGHLHLNGTSGPNLALVQLCLEAKADPDMCIEQFYTAFPTSADRRCSVLGCAIESGNVEICKLLLGKKASVHCATTEDMEAPLDRYECTVSEPVLNSAVREGHVEICELLLQARADVNSCFSCSGYSAPMDLRGKGAQTRDSGKGTALFQASQRGQSDICRLLIDYGADPAGCAAGEGGWWNKGGKEEDLHKCRKKLFSFIRSCCEAGWAGWYCYRCGTQR